MRSSESPIIFRLMLVIHWLDFSRICIDKSTAIFVSLLDVMPGNSCLSGDVLLTHRTLCLMVRTA